MRTELRIHPDGIARRGRPTRFTGTVGDGRRARGRRRRGNAMIMAVALTSMLAIIGSSFVLMSRIDRQSVQSVDSSSVADAAAEHALTRIQRLLADAKVGGDSFDDVNRDGRYTAGVDAFDPARHDTNGNGRYDPVILLSGKTADGLDRVPFDYPDNNHPWLTAIEPDIGTGGNSYLWPHVSQILSTAQRSINAEFPLSSAHTIRDADGDGIVDTHFEALSGFAASGKVVQVGVRIIDNSGLANVNTSLKRLAFSNNTAEAMANPARDGQWNSQGEFIHQFDLSRLLRRTGIDDPVVEARSVDQQRLHGQSLPALMGYDLFSVLYDRYVIGDYGWFGRFPMIMAQGLPLQPFSLLDELELRNRFTVNTSTQTLLEAAMELSIGAYSLQDPTGVSASQDVFRIIPYGKTDAIGNWFAQLTDNRTLMAGSAAAQLQAVPRAEQRHLLTTYSVTSEFRLPDYTAAPSLADQFLDRFDLGGVGPFRKVNVNTVIHRWLTTDFRDPAQGLMARRDVLRLAKAFEASGFTLDQGFQFVANLIDFVDDRDPFDPTDWNLSNQPKHSPTIFPAASFNYIEPNGQPSVDAPSVTIVGTEPQPVITEVFNKIELGASTNSAVEIFNPPNNGPININGWVLRSSGGTMVPVVLSGIPPLQAGHTVVVVRTEASAGVDKASGTVHVMESANLVLAPGESLLLARPVVIAAAANAPPPPFVGTWEVVIDRVNDTPDLQQITPTNTSGGSLWRGMNDWTTVPYLAPWAFTRNTFGPPSSTHMLGKIDKVTTVVDPLNSAGLPIRVDNRGPVWVVPTQPNYASYWDVNRGAYWRVRGLYELGRVLMVGNPIVGSPGQTITERFAAMPLETFNDVNGDGVYSPTSTPPDTFVDLNNNGTRDYYVVTEFGNPNNPLSWVRLNLAAPGTALLHPTNRLFNRISFFSRADNGEDNENQDRDYTPSNPQAGLLTMADSLAECRLPGRINVNTAPEAVLKALVPALVDPGDGTAQWSLLTEAEVDTLSAWYARALVWMRSSHGGGPFISLPDVLARLDAFNNPRVSQNGALSASGQPVLQWATPSLASTQQVPADQPNALRFGVLVDCLKGRKPTSGWVDPNVTVTKVGASLTVVPWEFLTYGDSEERDWVFTRMANLLTVRSDTFTAYIAVRVADRNDANNYLERRYVATIDRSNVLLPEEAGKNGNYRDPATGLLLSDPLAPADYADDSGEMLRFGFEAGTGRQIYAPATPSNLTGLEDPDHFDRQYTTPKIVAFQRVPDPR